MSGGHREMLWGALQMIHMWETFPPQAGFLGRMWERSSSRQRSHAPNKQKEAFPPWWGRDHWKSLLTGALGVKSLPGTPEWLDNYLEEHSSGVFRKMGHIRLRKFSKVEVVGFLVGTPYAHLPLCLLAVGDRTWVEWTRLRTCHA